MSTAFIACVVWVFTKSTPLKSDRPVTLHLAHWQIERGPPDGIAAVIRRYEEINPRVKVDQMLIPGAVYRQWLRTTLAGQTAPELIEYGAWLENVADVPLRYFEPLTEYLLEPNPYNKGTPLEGVPWLKTFADELLEQRINSPEPGQYYCVTMSRGSRRLFCNLELLREITGSDQPPATLDEFFALCDKVKAYGVKRGRPLMPLAGAKDNMLYLTEIYMHGILVGMTFANDRDGLLTETQRQNIAAYLDGRWNYRRPEVKAAFGIVQKLARQMKPGFMQLVRDDAVQEFMRGDALFIFSGTFDATSLRRLASFPVGGFRVPQPTKNDPIAGKYLLGRFVDGDNTTGFGFYLNKAGRHRPETIDFLRFLTSYEGGKIFMKNSGWITSVDKVPVPPSIAGDLSPIDGYGAGPAYINPGSECSQLFQRELYHLVGPTGSVDEFTEALDRAAPMAMTKDLQTEQRNQRLTLAPRDLRIAAVGELARDGAAAAGLRRDRLESAQNQSEGLAFMLDYQLRHSVVKGTQR